VPATNTRKERARGYQNLLPIQPQAEHSSNHGYQWRVEREILLRTAARAPRRRRRRKPGECAAEHEQAEPEFGRCDRSKFECMAI
jgi:hypothetical protein